jgi:hypothetical protein
MAIELRDIADLLNTQLLAAAIVPPEQIAWMNSTFTPTKNVSYLDVAMAGRARTPIGFGADGFQQWQGIYQVSVFVPRDTGTSEQDNIAAKVLAAFPRGLTLISATGVRLIVEYSSPTAINPFGDWSSLPIEIHWFGSEP